MKRIEREIHGFAVSVLLGYRLKDGLTCYAHADNRAKDIRHMTETMREELPRLLKNLGVMDYLESLGEE